MRFLKNRVIKFRKYLRRLFRPGLPSKPHSFKFGYYSTIRDFALEKIIMEKFILEDYKLFYSKQAEYSKEGKIEKQEGAADISSDFNSFYAFLRKVNFHLIDSPSEHVSIYPGTPTIVESMELELCKRGGEEPIYFFADHATELALSGENLKRFTQVAEYLENLKRKYIN